MKSTRSTLPDLLLKVTLGSSLLLSLLLGVACSDASRPETEGSSQIHDDAEFDPGSENLSADSQTQTAAPTDDAKIVPEELDPTLRDHRPLEYVFETIEMPEAPQMTHPEQSRFWYEGIPEDTASQIAYRQEVRQEIRELQRNMRMIERQITADDEQLNELHGKIGEFQTMRANLIEQSPEMLALHTEHEQRVERLREMRGTLTEKAQKLRESGKLEPEMVDRFHVRKAGCCARHEEDEDREPTPFELYMQDVMESRALLTKIGGFARKKGELENSLTADHPEISTVSERLEDLETRYRNLLDEHPKIQSLQRLERQLTNKDKYLSRVIMGDERYVRNPSQENTSN